MPESKTEKKASEKTKQPSTKDKVILAVADKGSLNKLKDKLTAAGLSVKPLASGFEALEQLLAEGADAVILDDNLGDIKGSQLACLIKSSNSQMPLVLLSNHEQDDPDFWRLACRADACLNTSQWESLAKTVNEAISKSKEGGSTSDNNQPFNGLALPGKTKGAIGGYEHLFQSLLIERIVAGIMSNLLDNIEPRNKFLEKYFQAVSQLFGSEAVGIAVVSTSRPWACFQTKTPLSRKAYEAIVADLEKGLNGGTKIVLERLGDLADADGNAISHEQILPVKQDKTTIGALVFATCRKKPFDQFALQAMGQLQKQILPIMRLMLANQELEILHQREQYRSSTDVLTGLYNLEFLVGFLQQQLLFSFRQRSPVGLVIIDIDHLKAVNDGFGYEMGDHVLSTIGNKMLSMTRSSDLIARYGGGSFAVVMPNTDINGARVVAEKVRLEIQQMKFVRGGERKGPHVTVSIGCSCFNMEDLNPETILRDAKLALKRSKEHGGNRVAI
jgi:diguanylate cyclase (GGDEF)-like protein